MNVNKAIIIGRLGHNPELRHTPAGQSVVNFSIATSDKWQDKAGQKQERTEWHRIVAWGKLADLIVSYLAKGDAAYVEGKLQTREWQDKDGTTRYSTEILAENVRFLGKKNSPGETTEEPNPFGH